MDGVEANAPVADALADGVFVLADGRFTYVNDALSSLVGREPSTLVGERFESVTVEGATFPTPTEGSDQVVDVALERPDGDPVPCEVRTTDAPAGTTGDVTGVVRTVPTAQRRRETITQLQDSSRSLMQAPSRESVAEVVVSAVTDVLGYDMNAVRLYDADRRALETVAVSGRARDRMADRPTYELDEAGPGRVFSSGEPLVVEDLREAFPDRDLSPARSAMYFPMGVHGTLTVGSTEPAAFDEVDRQVAALLATNAAAACNRAKREREVREAREHAAAILDRVEGVIQDTVEVLVQATTREDVEAGVTEQLAAADPYLSSWVARPDLRKDRLVAREWAGDALDVAEVSVPVDREGTAPGVRAHASGDSQVVDLADAGADGRADWLTTARDAGVESVMAIPLSYTDSTYGVLYVCADRADAFDDREQVVLEALGRAVANTINAIESGRILSASQVIELEFTVEDRDLLFSRVSAGLGAELEATDTVTDEDAIRVYLSAAGADGDDVLAALGDDDAVDAATRVADHGEESLFEVSVGDSLLATLVDHGAVPTGLVARSGTVRYTVELPHETDVREIFGLVEDRYEGVDLVGYHEHERPVRTQQDFRATLGDRFTDRQETALRTAFLGGFFSWPRDVDGHELADSMDITRQTFHQHLRTAQRKVLEELFEADPRD